MCSCIRKKFPEASELIYNQTKKFLFKIVLPELKKHIKSSFKLPVNFDEEHLEFIINFLLLKGFEVTLSDDNTEFSVSIKKK